MISQLTDGDERWIKAQIVAALYERFGGIPIAEEEAQREADAMIADLEARSRRRFARIHVKRSADGVWLVYWDHELRAATLSPWRLT